MFGNRSFAALALLVVTSCFRGDFLEGVPCRSSGECSPQYVCVFPTFTEIADGADEEAGECGFPPDPEETPIGVAGGSFAPLEGYADITGLALLVRRDNQTNVSVQLSGLTPVFLHSAQVHARSCVEVAADLEAQAETYKFDPREDEPDETNELRLTLTSDEGGSGRAELRTDHLARVDARSVVLQDPDATDAVMACADLVVPGGEDNPLVSLQSAVVVLPPAVEAGFAGITATATMERSIENGTRVAVTVQGLAPGTAYPVDVHETSCAVADGSFEYRIDPEITESRASNELHLPVVTDATGSGSSAVSVPEHVARADARSIVIHGDAEEHPRFACIDLLP